MAGLSLRAVAMLDFGYSVSNRFSKQPARRKNAILASMASLRSRLKPHIWGTPRAEAKTPFFFFCTDVWPPKLCCGAMLLGRLIGLPHKQVARHLQTLQRAESMLRYNVKLCPLQSQALVSKYFPTSSVGLGSPRPA